MTTATESGRPSLMLALLVLALLVICAPVAGQTGESQNERGCTRPRRLPSPSYESFFGRQRSVAAESHGWRINLEKRESSPECGNQFLFQVTNKQTSATSQFMLCDPRTVQVDEVVVVTNRKAVVLGRAGASFPVVTVVELPSGEVVDRFSCQSPALSPGHRFLAFVKSFPGHPGPVVISFQYIVYDLTRSADYNRPKFKPGVKYDAGWPVYPPGATNAVGENVLPEGSPRHGWSSRGLFWLDDQTLAFTDFFGGHNRLVVVDLSPGIREPDVRTLDLDPAQLVDLDQCKKSAARSDFETWSKEPAGLIRVQQIDPVPGKPGMACLYFVPSPCLRYASIMVKLP